MNIVAIIPARMGASRFPGKPLAKICGIPMVGHCYFRTIKSEFLTDTYVATCDKEIYDYVESIGGKAVMTADTHERCTDRTAEAMLKIEEQTGKKIDMVCMVQGDEPLVFPNMIDQSIVALKEAPESVGVSCLKGLIKTEKEFLDPNIVKLVTDLNDYALYFSREPIPTAKKSSDTSKRFKQVPIMSFRRDYLLRFNDLTPTPLEILESVDMMRVLEHGDRLIMAETDSINVSVDIPDDISKAEDVMKNDSLFKTYS